MKKFLLQIALFLSAGTLLNAQVYQQGFFLKDYRPVYRINPALFPDSDFIGGFELTRNKVQNYGVSTFYYPVDGGLVTGLHESISADQFLSRIPNVVARNGEIGLNLFSYGIRRGDAYHSFEIGFRLPTTMTAPKGIFDLLKRGTTGPRQAADRRVRPVLSLHAVRRREVGRGLHHLLESGDRPAQQLLQG